MLTAQDRAQATYNALSASGRLNACNDAERAQVLSQLRLFLGADVNYLKLAAEILPGSLQAQPGASVSTPTGPGSVTSPSAISGEAVLT